MTKIDFVRAIITGALLAGYVIVFAQDAYSIWRKQKPPETEAKTYIWTAISVLVGGVTAFAFGVEFPHRTIFAAILSPEDWRAIYAAIYTATGLAAVVTWASRSEWTSTLIKNLATTFLGIAIPVVSAWLIAPPVDHLQ